MRIALAGNPNSGKTTMFNVLTGKNEKVGNWAGVTVERKEFPIRRTYAGGREDLIAVDLPGAYSMSPFTSEESVTSTYVKEEHPDAIINIVDATNLSRSLFFTTQLLELGIPLVVALNKSDANDKKGNHIDVPALSRLLGCPVVETVSVNAEGMEEAVAAALSVIGTQQTPPFHGSADLNDRDAVRAQDKERYAFVNDVVHRVEQRRVLTKDKNAQDTADELLTNKWLGLPIFALVMFAVFWISQMGPGVWIADLLVGVLESGQSLIADALASDSIWASILVDGIIGGFIAIIGFLPLVMVMYFLIALLEDCGYMARATVVLDPIFKRVGLSGKSVIPFVVGTGCAIPGVMACRTIRDERERRTTAMLAPLMPCGAKLPVISLFASAFFSDAWWVGPLMYFVAIALILACALLVNALNGHRPRKSFFIMELPEYKLPSLKKAAVSMCQRGWSYVVKAGTVILVCNFAVHLMQNFTWTLTLAESAEDSILATVATPFAWLFAPIVGYVSWQLAAAAITGFIAKENVVATLAVTFGLTNLINPDEMILEEGASVSEIAAAFGMGSGGSMLAAAALAYLLFNLFTPPCFAAMGAMRAEIDSRKWFFAGIGIQFSVGYSLGFLTYFFGTLFTGETFHAPWCVIVGWCIVVALAALYTLLILKKRREDRMARTAQTNTQEATV